MAKSKKQLIEEINNAFIDVLQEDNARTYVKYIKSINRELIDNIDTLTPRKAKEIINRQSINIDNMALIFTIQSSILLMIDKPDERKKPSLMPIYAVMGMYSLSNPKRFVRQVVKIAKGVDLNDREKVALQSVKQFKTRNKALIENAGKKAVSNLNRSVDKSGVYRRMVKDFEKTKGTLTTEQIKKKLLKRYNNNTSIERALDTELHAQSELVKKEHYKSMGLTHKIWKTQGDGRVRETCFHKNIANKEVLIDSDFRACGLRAEYPGDERLPANERIRCRCYTIYR